MAAIDANPADLAPGDQRCRDFDFAGFTLDVVRSTADPLFRLAYDQLWAEFGGKNEIETEEVLARRFAADPRVVEGDLRFAYEMLVLRHNGQFAGVRDHNVILTAEEAVVHLSHVLIAPAFRGTGLAGWLRALPIDAARRAQQAADLSPATVTLVAEMEPLDATRPDTVARLRSYARAGFRKLQTPYLQPDFRTPSAIDAAAGPRPLPMSLIVRQVGRETVPTMPAATVTRLIRCLYRMYARTFRPTDMAACWPVLDAIGPGTSIPLIDPTAG